MNIDGLVMPWRLEHGFFGWPTLADALSYPKLALSRKRSPFGYCAGFAKDRDPLAASAVVSLLGSCGPSAVVGRVVAIVVDSIKAVFPAGALAHISEECKKVIPLRADSNAPAPVATVSGVAGDEAPSAHSCPGLISECSCVAVGFVVAIAGAAARLAGTALNAASISNLFATTVTGKQPVRVAVPALNEFDSGKFVKLLTWGDISLHKQNPITNGDGFV